MKLYKDTDSELHSSTAFDVKKASNEQELEKLMATFDNTLLFMDKLKSQITLLSTKTSIKDVEHKSQLMKRHEMETSQTPSIFRPRNIHKIHDSPRVKTRHPITHEHNTQRIFNYFLSPR